jgi:hypothetical protein
MPISKKLKLKYKINKLDSLHISEFNYAINTDVPIVWYNFYNEFSYAPFTKEHISKLINVLKLLKIHNILEIGSGTGLYAKMIKLISKFKNYKIKLHVTDFIENRNNWKFDQYTQHYKYENIHPDNAIKKYIKSTLFLCYPPNDNDLAFNMLIKFTGMYFIYIGESQNGCCANDKFFNELKKNYILIYKISLLHYTRSTYFYDADVENYIFIYKK